jgi:hypothetical protein
VGNQLHAKEASLRMRTWRHSRRNSRLEHHGASQGPSSTRRKHVTPVAYQDSINRYLHHQGENKSPRADQGSSSIGE